MENCEVNQMAAHYRLPSWRALELLDMASQLLCQHKYYEKDFDYKKMIASMGVRIKPYSTFTPKNLERLRKETLGMRLGGLALREYDPHQKRWCCLVAYDDQDSSLDEMEIIIHEFSHIYLGHTQQSVHAEAEAIYFSVGILGLLHLERITPLGKYLEHYRMAGKTLTILMKQKYKEVS